MPMTDEEFDKLKIPKCLDRCDPELVEYQRLEREAKREREKASEKAKKS